MYEHVKYEVLEIKTVASGESGSLSFVESDHDIPFEIKRIYYTYEVPVGFRRGKHAHRQLDQLLFCPNGCIEVYLDDGSKQTSVMLDSPSKGLLLHSMIWREMVWRKENSLLVVAASDFYDESDYIRDYDDFMLAVETQGAR
ncbi:FdtA/QdtA family cupin domain-containing protein [Eggerthella guodeyinii]|uniref:FdtA/QdtA family cupin domain-containing protein n=2 Tax=Eggerthella guodeyinii TaxID=2690837 RepID=A0A6L7INE7_9ACTN|nr:FdtA/QdtA family cupin domain-containing protein [Eggerthella guodeyinii]